MTLSGNWAFKVKEYIASVGYPDFEVGGPKKKKAVAEIYFKGPDRNAPKEEFHVVLVFLANEAKSLAPEYTELKFDDVLQKGIYFFIPPDQYQKYLQYLDLLRNEKPVYCYFDNKEKPTEVALTTQDFEEAGEGEWGFFSFANK